MKKLMLFLFLVVVPLCRAAAGNVDDREVHIAAEAGDWDKVYALMDKGEVNADAKVNVGRGPFDCSRSLVERAIDQKKPQVLVELLGKGVRPSLSDLKDAITQYFHAHLYAKKKENREQLREQLIDVIEVLLRDVSDPYAVRESASKFARDMDKTTRGAFLSYEEFAALLEVLSPSSLKIKRAKD